MEQVELGRTGVEIPVVGMGTWNYSAGPEPLLAGLDAGAAFIDTAKSYGTEAMVGNALKGWGKKAFLATKVSAAHLAPDRLRKAVN
ncbi:MAG: hypothetical protein FJ405_12100, partial [Verrucomicrobia bacterium]|nr:hypothetical protein [Verrucomicrobiota bacterium]